MNINIIKKDKAAKIVLSPRNEGDVGFDVCAASDPTVVGRRMGQGPHGEDLWGSIDYIEYDTGIVIDPEDKRLFTLAMPRSSISKQWLGLCNAVGLIDNGYRGTVRARFNYLWQPDYAFFVNGGGLVINPDKIYKKGDAILQLVFMEMINHKIEFKFTDGFEKTERGEGGFGSTNDH